MAQLKLEEIKEMVENEGYEFLAEEYREVNGRRRRWIQIKCDKKHGAYWTRLDVFKKGHRCTCCKNENYKGKWNKNEIIKYIEKEGYIFIEFIEFNKVLSKIKISCPKGHKYEVVFKKFLDNRRCPRCNESKGEKEIEKVLDKYNIQYQRQYKFKDCRLKNALPFDFYLIELGTAIEFDGSQHHQISEHFGGLDRFIGIKIHDTVKNEYCKKNNIKLIRIPYWEFDNIERIIVNELKLK